MPPARTHFCDVVARLIARVSRPVNTSLNWTMPALVNSSVGSFSGTSADERTRSWPRSAKKSRKADRTWSAFMIRESYQKPPAPGAGQNSTPAVA